MEHWLDRLTKTLASGVSRRALLRQMGKLGIAALGARLVNGAGKGRWPRMTRVGVAIAVALALPGAPAIASEALLFDLPVLDLGESLFIGRTNRTQFFERDLDLDGLKDDLEDLLAEHFKPRLRFDRDENARRDGEPIVLFQVRPSGCAGMGCAGATILIRWAFLFIRDGGYGPGTGFFCEGEDDHPGDNDEATYVLRSTGAGRTWRLTEIHLGGFPGVRRSPGTDSLIEMEASHPVIYMSTGKHHEFFHSGDWDDSPYSDVPFFDDCGDDVDGDGDVIDPDLRSVTDGMISNNVGEPESHDGFFVNDLSHLFPVDRCPRGRAAWSRERFCGGAPANASKWVSGLYWYQPFPPPAECLALCDTARDACLDFCDFEDPVLQRGCRSACNQRHDFCERSCIPD